MATLKYKENGVVKTISSVRIKGGGGSVQSKTALPTKQRQEILPDSGYDALSKVTVEPIPSNYIIPTGTKTINENGTFNVKEFEQATVNVPVPEPELQEKSITITSNGTQTVLPDDDYDGLSEVNITTNVKPNLQPKSVIPSKQGQIITADAGYDGLQSVLLGAIPSEYIIPEGTKEITENGNVDVTNFANVDVNVPSITERMANTLWMLTERQNNPNCVETFEYDDEDYSVLDLSAFDEFENGKFRIKDIGPRAMNSFVGGSTLDIRVKMPAYLEGISGANWHLTSYAKYYDFSGYKRDTVPNYTSSTTTLGNASARILVPKALESAWKSASGWANMATQIIGVDKEYL